MQISQAGGNGIRAAEHERAGDIDASRGARVRRNDGTDDRRRVRE